MIVIGFDLAGRNTGAVAISWEGDGDAPIVRHAAPIVSVGEASLHREIDLGHRLCRFVHDCDSPAELVRAVAVEDAPFGVTGKATTGVARGYLYNYLERYEIDVTLVPISRWRSFYGIPTRLTAKQRHDLEIENAAKLGYVPKGNAREKSDLAAAFLIANFVSLVYRTDSVLLPPTSAIVKQRTDEDRWLR